jgi:hypothetical protein
MQSIMITPKNEFYADSWVGKVTFFFTLEASDPSKRVVSGAVKNPEKGAAFASNTFTQALTESVL